MRADLKTTSLQDALSLVIDYRGKTPKKLGGDWSSSGYMALSANNVKFDGLVNLGDVRYLDEKLYKKWMKEEVKRGDLLLTSEAPSGQVLVWNSDEKIVLSQRLYALRVNNQISNLFLKYYLQSEAGQREIQRNNSGSTVGGISAKTFPNIQIKHPEKNVQKKIGGFLYLLDQKIELNNRINSELEAMAKTLYDYWFVQFDFPDANGKPYRTAGGKMVYNTTLKREIPIGWEDKTLSDIANITMGQSPSGDSYNEERVGTIFFQGSTDFGWLFPATRQYTTAPSRMAKKGDILLSVRAPVGDMNIANNDCCIGRGLAALNSKTGSDGFLFYVMKYFKQIFDRRNSEGTTFGSITKDDLHSLPLAYPGLELLKKYDGIVSSFNKMIFERSLENERLTVMRDWLLPILMNGQVTVQTIKD